MAVNRTCRKHPAGGCGCGRAGGAPAAAALVASAQVSSGIKMIEDAGRRYAGTSFACLAALELLRSAWLVMGDHREARLSGDPCPHCDCTLDGRPACQTERHGECHDGGQGPGGRVLRRTVR